MSFPIPSFDGIVKAFIGMMPAMRRFWKDYINGPAISARLLDSVDNPWRSKNAPGRETVYLLEIRNVGGGVAIPRVFLNDVTDEQDRFAGIVTPVEIFISPEPGLPRLFGEAKIFCTILNVDWTRQEGPSLYFYYPAILNQDRKEERKPWAIRLVGASPLEQQKEIRLAIRVVFYSADDPQKELMDKILRYSVKPLPDSNEYRVRQLKLGHSSIFNY
jgi:hypothetical protein